MKKAKILSLVLACSLLFHTTGMEVLATTASEPVFDEQSVETPESAPSEEDIALETPEQSTEEVTGNDSEEVQDTEQSSEPEEGKDEESSDDMEETEEPSEETEEPSDETDDSVDDVDEPAADDTPEEDEVSDSEDSVSDNTVSENTLPEEDSGKEDPEEDVLALFPGLGDDYTMSSAQMADKRVLADHVNDIVSTASINADQYPDAEGLYELGEVVYLAETAEEAEQVAAAFGGDLDSYAYGVAVISLPEKATVAMAVAAAAAPEMKLPAVWPNYYYYLTEDVNDSKAVSGYSDPALTEQWQHDYIGTGYAWAAGYKGQGVKVAVIDTGLQRDHEDLSNNAAAGRNFVGGATGTEFNGDNGEHGTHVAGIIAADDNGTGGVGIAPDAQVRGYCVFPAGDDAGADSADIMMAINAAVADGNDIINMSLGGPMYSAAYETSVKNAYNKGVAVFASSGNEDTDGYSFPAAYSGVISVGAVDQNGARAAFSNYGGTVKLSFPGVHIYSTLPVGYGYMSGTSQASPAAAGTAAVILSADQSIRGKSGKAKVDALLAKMKSSTTKCTSSGMGAGTTWLPGALKIASDITAPDAPVITINETPQNGTTYTAESVTATLSTKTAVDVEIWYSTDGKNPAYKNGEVLNASRYTGTPVTLTGAKKVTIKALALNPVTGKASKVAVKSCTLAPIPSDVVLTSKTGNSSVAAGKSLVLVANVMPDYAVSKKVQWNVDAAAKAAGITVTNGTVKTKSTTAAGEYTVTATAVGTDGSTFNGVSKEYKFTVIAKASVKSIAFMDGKTKLKAQTLDRGQTLNLNNYLQVTREDGAAAAGDVIWSSSNNKVATVSDGVVTAVAPGKVVIKAISNDGFNKSASCNVTVNQPVTEITITGSTKVAAGKSITLKANIAPANATNKKVTWTVDGGNGKVTVANNGKVSAKADATGTCTVTATANDSGKVSSAAYTVTIVSGAITKIELSSKNMVLFSKKASETTPITGKLSATVTGGDSSLIEWMSSAPSIASVDQDGNVTAKAAGKATITCAATDGSNKKATCKVNVNVPMSKLSIGTKDSYGSYFDDLGDGTGGYAGYIAQGKSIVLTAKYSSNYGTPNDKKVTWASSNTAVLTVDKNGKVTANKEAPLGAKAYITATAADGSGVTSNQYLFAVRPLFKQISIEEGSHLVTATLEDGRKVVAPDYFTVTVSGGKNPGLDKWYQQMPDGSLYCFIDPIPGQVTTDKPSSVSQLYTNEMQKMTMTVKLRDGSGLTAKLTLYAARFKDGTIKYTN